MITPEEMKRKVQELRKQKQEIQKTINLYVLCLKELGKARGKQQKDPDIKKRRLAAFIDYVENGTKAKEACRKAGLAKHRWGTGSIEEAWRENFPDHYWHIFNTEYEKDRDEGKNYTFGTYVRHFKPIITKEIREKLKP